MNYKRKEEKIIDYLLKGGKNIVTDEMSINDILFEFEQDKWMIGEIKCREHNHNRYPDWILEKDKKDSLFKLAEKYDDKLVLYFNYFTDDTLVVWDLQEVFKKEKKLEKRWMNKHSDPSFKHYNEKVLKDVYMLTLQQCYTTQKIKL